MVAFNRIIVCLLGIILLVGCQPSSPEPAPTPAATRTASAPLPTTTPTLAVDLPQLTLLDGPDHRLWTAGSLTNQSDQAVQDLEIQLNFLDEDGDLIHQISLSPHPPVLPPGGTGHIVSPYQGDRPPMSVSASLISYQSSQQDLIELEFELEAVLATTEGGTRIFGSVEHPSVRTLRMVGFSILAANEEGPSALPATLIAPRHLPAGTPSPWLARFNTEIEVDALSILGYGRAPDSSDRSCQLVILEEPGLQLDPQGNPYFAGILQNQEVQSCQVRVLLQVIRNGKSLNLFVIDSPIPLEAEEQRPFGFRIEPPAAANQLEDLEILPHFESELGVELSPLALSLRLTSVENFGSNVFIKGVVTNPTDDEVRDPTIFAALRSTEGQVLTAKWLLLPDSLEAGQTADFVLALPINADFDLGLAEFDLRALALPPQPSD